MDEYNLRKGHPIHHKWGIVEFKGIVKLTTVLASV